MTMKKTFEVKKNGYRMFIVEDSESTYKSLDIAQDTENLPKIYLEVPSRMDYIMQNNAFDELDMSIGTMSIGSQSVEDIKQMVQYYELAIEAVEYFKAELIKLK